MSALSPSQQPTGLFSIYQNNTWTIRSFVAETIDPATQCIKLKIVRFIVFRSSFPWFCKIWGDVGSNPNSGKWFFSSQSQPYLQGPINFWMEWVMYLTCNYYAFLARAQSTWYTTRDRQRSMMLLLLFLQSFVILSQKDRIK